MSVAIQFDTLRYVEKLKSAGISEAHAEAKVGVLAIGLGESASGLLATKDDITSVKLGLANVKSELKLMTRMVVTIVAGVVLLVAKAYLA